MQQRQLRTKWLLCSARVFALVSSLKLSRRLLFLSVAHESQPVERVENLEYRNQLSGVCWGAVYYSIESIFLNHSIYYFMMTKFNWWLVFVYWTQNVWQVGYLDYVFACCSTVQIGRILLSERHMSRSQHINPSNAELNPICHLLILLRAHPILHVSRIRVKVFVVFNFGYLKK